MLGQLTFVYVYLSLNLSNIKNMSSVRLFNSSLPSSRSWAICINVENFLFRKKSNILGIAWTLNTFCRFTFLPMEIL